MDVRAKKRQIFILVFLMALFSVGAYFLFEKNKCLTIIYLKKPLYLTNSTLNSTENEQLKLCSNTPNLPEKYERQAAIKDFETTVALEKYLSQFKNKIIGVMGRGSIKRDSKQYQNAAFIGKKLAEQGYIVITGGGPGTMEATHLGVWFAGRTEQELMDAINLLKKTTNIESTDYLKRAIEVKQAYPKIMKTIDIAIPTFVYGVEFGNIFAETYVSYFNNAVREEAMIILSKNGIILLPGGYGTMLELFFALEYNSDEIKTDKQRPILLFNSTFWKKTFGPALLNKVKTTDSIEDLSSHLSE